MKILLPIEEESLNANLYPSFGRASKFCIYNTETKEVKYAVNEAASSAGGAGIKAAQTVVDLGANVLITERLGKNAAEVIEAAGVKILKASKETIMVNIELAVSGKLDVLTDIHPGFHNHGEN